MENYENIYEDDYDEYDINENKIKEPEDDYFEEELNNIQYSKDKIQDLNNLIEIDKLNYPKGSKWSYKCYENLCIIYKENKDINNFILCFENLMKLYERMDNIITENLFYKILNISFNSDFDFNISSFQENIINNMLMIIKSNNYNKAYNDLKSLIIKIKNYSFKNDIVSIFNQKITTINQDIFSINYSNEFIKILKTGIILKISETELSFFDNNNILLHKKQFPKKIIPINVEVMENGDLIILYVYILFNIKLNMIILKDDKFQFIELTNYISSTLIKYNYFRGKTLIKEIKNKNKFILINSFNLMIIFSSIGEKYIIETILKNSSIFPFYEELNNYYLIVEWNIISKLIIKKLNKNTFDWLDKRYIYFENGLKGDLTYRNIEMFNENYLIISLLDEIYFILLKNCEIIKSITLSDCIYCLQKIDNIIVVLDSKLNFITQEYNKGFQIDKNYNLKYKKKTR